jgi:hypothetical protein
MPKMAKAREVKRSERHGDGRSQMSKSELARAIAGRQ